MSNNFWLTTTTKPGSISVVPVYGGAFGVVCPQRLRATDAMTIAHLGQGFHSWSPPIT